MLDFLGNVWENVDTYLAVLGAAVTLATTVVALTPTKKDDEAVAKAVKWFNKLTELVSLKKRKAE